MGDGKRGPKWFSAYMRVSLSPEAIQHVFAVAALLESQSVEISWEARGYGGILLEVEGPDQELIRNAMALLRRKVTGESGSEEVNATAPDRPTQ